VRNDWEALPRDGPALEPAVHALGGGFALGCVGVDLFFMAIPAPLRLTAFA